MNYVPRRIQITAQNNKTKTVSDIEFAEINAPLVLLGEPGAGKTQTAKAICTARKGTYFTAYRLASGVRVHELVDSNPVIDGLDEVQTNNSDQPLTLIFRQMENCGIRSFALTCRAADWANVQNERAVENWFGKKPVVGHLQPLNDSEIEAMVDSFGTYSSGGEEFVSQAKERNAIDLARNPQSLRLLLAAVAEAGWPRTKTELFELACKNFAKEQNPIHSSLVPQRPSVESLLSTAGFVCAQLLLSGKRGINVDGQQSEMFPRPVDLASDLFVEERIAVAASSLLFRPSGTDGVEPTHRTVAEYLGAKWLAGTLRTGTLSARRLDSLLYSQGAVPGSIRGLHAWLATLDRRLTDRLVSCDPYGCFRYGDTQQYSVEQARHLITQMQNLATIDPHFRSEDWEAQVGNGLARIELRDYIVELIQNPDIPYQLSTVVLESLNGTDLASAIQNDIRSVVLDEGMAYVTRDRAFAALKFGEAKGEWKNLANDLCELGTHDSIQIAVEVAINHVKLFNGEKLARIVVAYDRANEKQSVSLSLGLDYRLFPRMNSQQLHQAIPVLSSALPEGRHNRNDFERKIEVRLLEAVRMFLEKGGRASEEEILSWLHKVTRYHYRSSDWNTFSVVYFRQRPELRRSIQALVFENLAENELRLLNFHLGEMATGLMLDEEDISFHLNGLVSRKRELNDFESRLRALAELILGNSELIGMAERAMRQLAETNPILQRIVTQIERRPPPAWETENARREKKQALEKRRKTELRHQSYVDIGEEVQSGQHLGALNDIATTLHDTVAKMPENQMKWRILSTTTGSSNVLETPRHPDFHLNHSS